MAQRLPGTIAVKLHWVRALLGATLGQRRVEVLLFVTALGSVAYFFQGGGWNQNAHFATTVALVEQGTFYVDDYRHSTGDLARANGHVASTKPAGTGLAMVPGYLAARLATACIDNPGNRYTARAYLTTLLGPGLALATLAVVFFVLARRRLSARDAAWVALSMTLATPLFPYSTMTNSSPFVALFGVLSFVLLEGELGNNRTLVLAGLCAGLPAAFEYQTAVIALPLALFAAYRLRQNERRLAWVVLGLGLAASVPLIHHTIVYGHPLRVGYHSMANAGFARAAAQGWMGFDGFRFDRLFDMTLGHKKGYFFASPFLLAAVPGLVRMLRDPSQRAPGLAAGGAAWLMLLTVACLSYWHSGWGLASRYALLFVAFSVVPLTAIFAAHRGWILAGVGIALVFMLLAVAVTPTPRPGAPAMSVYGWLSDQLLAGNVAIRNEHVLVVLGDDGSPTWRTSFNLGQIAGVPGPWSILPYLALLGAAVRALWVFTRD